MPLIDNGWCCRISPAFAVYVRDRDELPAERWPRCAFISFSSPRARTGDCAATPIESIVRAGKSRRRPVLIAFPQAYAVANFGTFFRLRDMVCVGLVLIPLALSAPPPRFQ